MGSVAAVCRGAAGRDFVADGSAECDTMKVAIAQEGAAVSEHFGHCEGYAVYSIENNNAVWQENLANPAIHRVSSPCSWPNGVSTR
jgi:hypothetical protein